MTRFVILHVVVLAYRTVSLFTNTQTSKTHVTLHFVHLCFSCKIFHNHLKDVNECFVKHFSCSSLQEM